MSKILLVPMLFLALTFWSCSDKIDNVPLDYNEMSAVWGDSTYVRRFVNHIYNYLPDGYNRLSGSSMLDCATDDGVHAFSGSGAEMLAQGRWDGTYNPDDSWRVNYEGIRKVNDFMLNIVPNIPSGVFRSQLTVENLIGQACFLRAMFYFDLLKRYGGIPIIEDKLGIDSNVEIPRNSYDECVSYIVEQCDFAAEHLPLFYTNKNADFGRATKGAALALKARVLLYAASPLYNDPLLTVSSIINGAYQSEKWETAAEAAHQIIALDLYGLEKNFAAIFVKLDNNVEVILQKMAAPSNDLERLNGPSGYTGGRGGTGPSLNLIDAFEMLDGTPFNWEDPQLAADPIAYPNRDFRLYYSVIYNGLTWMGSQVETYQGGKDAIGLNATKTGFYMRKFLSQQAKWFGGDAGVTFHCFPLFRYSEVLLNYAEAMNEAYGPDLDPKNYGLTARQALDIIRARAGFKSSLPEMSQEDLRLKIRNERRVELAFEEHRYWDVRRWKIADQVLNSPVYGLIITKNEDETFSYERKKVEDRFFDSRMYFYPIPKTEINRNSRLEQNPGW